MIPYKEQIDAVRIAIQHHRGTISACTGFGKSVTMALLIEALQVKTLIIVPNNSLKEQLRQSMKEYFGSLKNITIENIDSPSLNKPGDYDCLIIDEAHHVAAKTYRNLNKKFWNTIYYRFFFTATPFRTQDNERILFESIAGRVIYTVNYQTAVDKGYIVPIEAYYIDLPKQRVYGRTWPQVYNELIVNNEYRNRIIAELLTRLSTSSTLCLVKEIAHGLNIQKALTTSVPFVKGENDDNREVITAFSQGHTPVIIGTTGVMGEGVDTKAAEFVIIAGLGKSKGQFMQSCGRGVRRNFNKNSCKIILFRDASHKYTLNHYNAQVRVLKEEYGVKPIKLDLIFN